MKICLQTKVISLLLFTPFFVQAGEWSRIDKNVISFSGEITAGDKASLLKVIKRTDKKLILNSEGGDAEEALRIANTLLPYRLHVIVDGICASSCANYLFTAGSIKEIKNGWVGFHGNLLNIYKESNNKIKTLNDYLKIHSPHIKETLSDKEVREAYSNYSNSLYHAMVADYKYFIKVGIKQEFFDLCFKLDKGMNDGKFYEFLLPTPQTFTKYGFKNVKGQQTFQQENVSYTDEYNNEINGEKFVYR